MLAIQEAEGHGISSPAVKVLKEARTSFSKSRLGIRSSEDTTTKSDLVRHAFIITTVTMDHD